MKYKIINQPRLEDDNRDLYYLVVEFYGGLDQLVHLNDFRMQLRPDHLTENEPGVFTLITVTDQIVANIERYIDRHGDFSEFANLDQRLKQGMDLSDQDPLGVSDLDIVGPVIIAT